jgi:hypothetical protein
MAAGEAMDWRNLMMIGEQQARRPWWHIYRAGIAEGMKGGGFLKIRPSLMMAGLGKFDF